MKQIAIIDEQDVFSAARKTNKKGQDFIKKLEFVAQLQNVINEDLVKFFLSLLPELNVAERPVFDNVCEYISYASYTFKNQFMNEDTLKRRVDKAARLLCKPKHP